MHPFARLAIVVAFACATHLAPLATVHAAAPTRITINPRQPRQEFQGVGCGVIFYEGHVTSLAARQRDDRQRELYDDMFARVPTRYLNVMIRTDHEPRNDNADPWTQAFDAGNFAYCEHAIAIAKAAKERLPEIELVATLYTPPAWMKTNNAESGGGEQKATLKAKHELELAECVWAFLAHMARNGAPVKYVAVSNECDWPHEQPGCFFTPEAHAALFKAVGGYLEKMAAKFPDVPRATLVGPNTLSAPAAAASYLPAMARTGGKYVKVIAAHDYDPRGDRWGDLRKLAGNKPVWMTEWCARGDDSSPGQINSATEYARAMHEAFTGGANVWMAYDWVYPPRKGGEALIHVEWGADYELKKPYWVFRQWATPLVPGMRVVRVTADPKAAPGVRATAFLAADKRSLVVHVVNLADAEAPVVLSIPGAGGAWTAPAARHRTSATEDMAELPKITPQRGGYADVLPAHSMTTYRLTAK